MKKMNNLKKIFTVSALTLALTACNNESNIKLNVEGGVSITGETTVGQTLTAQVSDVNGVDEATISYQWLSDSVAISGATASSYALTDSDVGSTIMVTANYTDNDDFEEAVMSAATDVIEAIAVNFEGAVSVSGIAEAGHELIATVTDENGLALEDVSYAWLAGTDAIGTDAPTVTLTNEEVGKTVTVTVTYVDNDEFAETVTSEATAAVAPLAPTDAEFSGDLSTKITSSQTESVTGTAIVTDLNEGEDSFQALNEITTTYGIFSITESGKWTYTLDTSNDSVAALTADDDDLIDTILISSYDDTDTALEITITGAEIVATKVVKMTDNNIDTSTKEEGNFFGQINPIVAGTPFETGKMTFSFKVENDPANDEINSSFSGLQSSRVTLSGENGNAREVLLELYFDRSGEIGLRNDKAALVLDQTFVIGDWVDVAITWDATSANDTDTTPIINVSIDDTPVSTSDTALTITNGSFSSLSISPALVVNGMEGASLKMSAGKSIVVDSAFYVDNVKVYSDIAGTASVFEDDFEAFAEGAFIDGDDITYTTNSNEAVIVTEMILP